MALLSKSTFLKGVQCNKYIYLDKYHKSKKDPLSEEQLKKFEGGHAVGELAKNYFKGGIDISLLSKSRQVLVAETTKHIQQGVDKLYESTFEYNDVLVMADVIIKSDESWMVYEVKSSQKISETNRIDAALQYYVMVNSGLPIQQFILTYLNYPRTDVLKMSSNEIPADLFLFEDVTDFCKNALNTNEEKIKDLKTILASPSIPQVEMGTHCNSPYTCEFIGYCNQSKNDINEGLFYEGN